MAHGEQEAVSTESGRIDLEQALLRRPPPPSDVSWEREMVRGHIHTFGEYKLAIKNVTGEEETIIIHEDTKMIATRVWDCATLTAKWIEYHARSDNGIPNLQAALKLKVEEDPSSSLQRPIQVLELGAGTGLLSVCLAKMGAAVLATEYGPVVKYLESNCQKNGVLPDRVSEETTLVTGKARCCELDWYRANQTLESLFTPQEEAIFDLIIVTDCSLTERDARGVFDMIHKYSTRGHTKIVVGTCLEREGTPLTMQLAQEYPCYYQVPSSELHPHYTSQRHQIVTFDA